MMPFVLQIVLFPIYSLSYLYSVVIQVGKQSMVLLPLKAVTQQSLNKTFIIYYFIVIIHLLHYYLLIFI